MIVMRPTAGLTAIHQPYLATLNKALHCSMISQPDSILIGEFDLMQFSFGLLGFIFIRKIRQLSES